MFKYASVCYHISGEIKLCANSKLRSNILVEQRSSTCRASASATSYDDVCRRALGNPLLPGSLRSLSYSLLPVKLSRRMFSVTTPSVRRRSVLRADLPPSVTLLAAPFTPSTLCD